MNWLCSLLWLVCLLVSTRGQKSDMQEVEDLLSLESSINLKNTNRLILIVGSTGTGKSTLAKFVTNDPSLKIVEVGRSTYVFRDNGTIGTNIRKSMTVVPNVYRDPETREAIVDTPGFSDTREPKYEIANAFFLKKVMEHARQLKIVVTENHFSLIEGMDRFGFSRLLRALAELIPSIERYRSSVSLVVTKVDHGFDEEDLKADLAQFFIDYGKELSESVNGNTTAQGMLRVLRVLAGDGRNVAFFRTPTLRDAAAMATSRESIRSAIFRKTRWADNRNAAFHYTLSSFARTFINHTLAPTNVNSAVAAMKVFFADSKSSTQAKIRALGPLGPKIQSLQRLRNQLSIVTRKPLTSLTDLRSLLSAFAPSKRYDDSVLVKLKSRRSFFLEFGVDVVQQLTKELRVEVEHLQQWLSNVQQQLQLEENAQLQAEADEAARLKAAKAAEAERQRVERARAAANRERERAQRVAAERAAAALKAKQAAERRARLARENLQKAQAAAEKATRERLERERLAKARAGASKPFSFDFYLNIG